MSTLKTENIQHPNATSPSIVLASNGTMSGNFPVINSNLLYNGAMQVHQRIAVSASATNINNYGDYISADRWYSEVPYLQSYGTIAQSVENDAPAGSGFRKSLRHAYSGSDAISAGKYMWISQKLEGQDCQAIRKGTASARPLTLSFWVKSNLTGTYIAELVDTDNTRYVSQSYTISSSNTWEFKTVTFPPDTTGVLNNDNGESLRLNFWLRGGSNFSGGASLQTTWGTTGNTRAVGQVDLAATVGNYWQVTGVKLEVGTSASEFVFKPFQQDLRECQRYFFRWDSATGAYKHFGIGRATTSTTHQAVLHFPITMRAAPDLSTSAASTFGVEGIATCTAISSGGSNPFNMTINVTTGSSVSVGRSILLQAENTTSAFVNASSEL